VHDEPIESDEEGALWCDLCDVAYERDECEAEIAYRTTAAATPTPVAAAPRFASGHALLVGIGRYRTLCPLDKAAGDARALYDLLTRAGYPRTNVHLLLDDRATKPAFNEALDRLARAAGPEGTVVIAFAGQLGRPARDRSLD